VADLLTIADAVKLLRAQIKVVETEDRSAELLEGPSAGHFHPFQGENGCGLPEFMLTNMAVRISPMQ
jgi:hypothetical protein